MLGKWAWGYIERGMLGVDVFMAHVPFTDNEIRVDSLYHGNENGKHNSITIAMSGCRFL